MDLKPRKSAFEDVPDICSYTQEEGIIQANSEKNNENSDTLHFENKLYSNKVNFTLIKTFIFFH